MKGSVFATKTPSAFGTSAGLVNNAASSEVVVQTCNLTLACQTVRTAGDKCLLEGIAASVSALRVTYQSVGASIEAAISFCFATHKDLRPSLTT